MIANVCVFTPTYNSLELLRDTVESILGQRNSGGYSLNYVVCDGGSTDGTLEYLDSVKGRFEHLGIGLRICSGPDKGMYDALSKGFRLAGFEYDVYCYINSGDYFSPYAFDVVAGVFSQGCNWITGMPATYNKDGHLIALTKMIDYDSSMIRQGVYGRFLPCIQQESTFWSGAAHRKINLDKLSLYKYAGDFYIWSVLAEHYKLYGVSAWLSGFRVHDGQQSAVFRRDYFEEFDSIRLRLTSLNLLKALLYRFVLYAPLRVRGLFSKNVINTEGVN